MSHKSIAAPGRPKPRLPVRRRVRASRALAAIVAVGVAILGAGAAWANAPLLQAPLEVTFLDVGQGDAVLIRAPEGQTALVDAGRSDIVPVLREMGVERIDLLVATHPDADHIGGMARVIESIPVRFYMDNGEPHTTATYRRLIAALEARPEITYLEATPRSIALGSATIEVLPLLPRGTADRNNRSVALVVRFGDFAALLSGDSEVRQLTHLTRLGAVPALTLLKAPHHGSDNGFTWDFLRAASPELVVISVGRNGYGHPRPEALQAYAATAGRTLRTDLSGHVQVLGYESGVHSVVSGEQVTSARGGEAAASIVVGAETAVVGTGRAAAPTIRLRLTVTADAPGNDNRNPNGEYVTLTSLEPEAIAVAGWRLCDLANHCFRFPAGAMLGAGATVTVHSGTGRADGSRYFMGYRRAVWNNNGDTATVYDERGAIVVAVSY